MPLMQRFEHRSQPVGTYAVHNTVLSQGPRNAFVSMVR